MLPCTNTGSLVDGADTAALLLAADVNLANGGAEPTRPVAGARVLHRRGRPAAIAASVGVTPAVPEQKPDESRTAVVRLLEGDLCDVRHPVALARAPEDVARGLSEVLDRPAHVHALPGHKTDRKDGQRICGVAALWATEGKLHSAAADS